MSSTPTDSSRTPEAAAHYATAVVPAAEAAVDVLVQRLDPDVPLPAYALPGDAGADLVTTVDATLKPGERAVLPTGLALAIPHGYAGFVHPRSGLAARCGVALVNAPGTIDSGYRGQIHVILINLDPHEPLILQRGDRIAQLVLQRVEQGHFREVSELPRTSRGQGGLGSTGSSSDLVTVGSQFSETPNPEAG